MLFQPSTSKASGAEGFTLLESVIVLMVLSIILFLPALSFEGARTRIETDAFFKELAASITLVQNQAVLENKQTSVTITSQHIYFESSDARKVLDYPEHIHYQEPTFKVHFSPGTGNINQFKHPIFQSPYGEFKLGFQLGSGRFEIKKVN